MDGVPERTACCGAAGRYVAGCAASRCRRMDGQRGDVGRRESVLRPLPPGAVTLTGGLEADLQRCIQHWQKEAVPYPQLVEFFRSGHPQFALGEMWGKAVRSGSMLYRYEPDPQLKAILDF